MRTALLILILTTIAGAGVGRAADYTYSTTVELNPADIYVQPDDIAATIDLTAPPLYTLNVGDILSGTITFADNQSLLIEVPQGDFTEATLIANSQGQDATRYNDSATLAGPGIQTYPFSNPSSNTGDSGSNAISAEVAADASSGTPFEVSSFQYSITITSVTGNNVFTPNSLDFFAYGGSISIVPEPRSGVMFLMGVGALVFRVRQRLPSAVENRSC